MTEIASEFWPWWLGGLALAATAVGFLWLVRAPLAVSGFCEGLLAGPSASQANEAAYANPSALEAALLEATQKRFGAQAVAPTIESVSSTANDQAPLPETLSWSARLAFVLALIGGGLLSATLSGRFRFQAGLGEDFTEVFGSGAKAIAVLLAGGFLAGFGTRMAGGCTSGHGLTGSARFQPGSLLATASFFGTGILVSFALEALLR